MVELGRPENIFRRWLPDRFKADDVDAQLQRWAGRLEPDHRRHLQGIIDSVSLSFDERVGQFSDAIQNMAGKENPRTLYAATALGLNHFSFCSASPVMKVTAAVTCGASVAGAVPGHLGQLTAMALKGLEQYGRDSKADPLDTAQGFIEESTDPHKNWFEVASTFTGHSPQRWSSALPGNSDVTLSRAFHIVLKDMFEEKGDRGHREIQDLLAAAWDYKEDFSVRAMGAAAYTYLDRSGSVPELLERLDRHAQTYEWGDYIAGLNQVGPDGTELLFLEDGLEVGAQLLDIF